MSKNLFEITNSPLIKTTQVCSQPTEIFLGNQAKTVYKHKNEYYMAAQLCEHRGMNLKHSQVCADSHLICPYHGRKNKPENKLIEKYNFLWSHDPSDLFKDVPDTFLFAGSQNSLLDAPFHVVLDNFNEGSHTPFVHKWVGSLPEELNRLKFSWSSQSNHTEINYETIQKKNILFYGLSWNRDIIWKIQWKTFYNPLYMQYYSEWFDSRTGKNILEKNLTYFFLNPKKDNQTEIFAFVFIQPLGAIRHIPFLAKKVSLLMTLNQIREDKVLYKKIQDLPKDLSHFKLDKFDAPLLDIRAKAAAIYSDFL